MRERNLFRLFTIFIFISQLAIGQDIAVTDRGDTVVLYSNGSWDYYDNYLSDNDESIEIEFSGEIFSKPKSSTKKINGANQAYEIWYNDKVWKRVPAGELNPEADVALKLLKGDAYAMVIYEEVEIPIDNLSQIALDNAVNVMPDIEMIARELRVVNNDTLIWMRMDGTTQGMKISYYSYYFSNKKGSIQFHTFTGQNLLEKYINELKDLLNGLQTNE